MPPTACNEGARPGMPTLSQFFVHPIVLFIAAMLIATTVHVGVMALVGRACGAGLHQVTIGFGPKLLSARLGATELALGPIPFGGYARFAAMGGAARSLDELPLMVRCFVAVSGCAALLLLAWLLAGNDAVHAGWRTIEALAHLLVA